MFGTYMRAGWVPVLSDSLANAGVRRATVEGGRGVGPTNLDSYSLRLFSVECGIALGEKGYPSWIALNDDWHSR